MSYNGAIRVVYQSQHNHPLKDMLNLLMLIFIKDDDNDAAIHYLYHDSRLL